ncbi:MAG: DUF5606 domain-containing protein [Bacteroidota bacterium]
MNLKGLIAIAGKPGLYKVIAQGKNTLIVESLIDGKRMPAYSDSKISALDDISMFTTEEDVPLSEVVKKIYEMEKGGSCVDGKAEPSEHHSYFEKVLPNYDKTRVYNSDLKKLFSWYNLLQSSGTLKKIEEEAKAAENMEEKKEATETAAEVKDAKPKKVKKEGEAKKKVVKKTEGKAKAESKAKSSARMTTTAKRGS